MDVSTATHTTKSQYFSVIADCKDIFLKKAKDYGPSWVILRLPSITDQIYIKAERTRSIQENKENLVGDSREGEFVAMVNYCVIALILAELQDNPDPALRQRLYDHVALEAWYDAKIDFAYEIMERKNHDYGEAWRNMRVSSFTDLILMKLLRLKQIEDNDGQTLISEGPEANYVDILNYSVFALIKRTKEA